MKVRTRTKSRTRTAGQLYWYGDLNLGSYVPWQEEMTDWIEKKKDLYGLLPSSSLDHFKFYTKPCFISGQRNSNHWVKGFPSSATRSYRITSTPTVHHNKFPSDEQLLNMLLARTNPSRPEFSIPVAIREFAELATLFSLTAKSFAGLAGKGYLNYRFGWKAFVRDIETLSNLTKVLESRLKELDSALKFGGIRRRIKLGEVRSSVPYSDWTVNSSYSTIVKLSGKTTYTTKFYGSIRWFPAPGAHQVLENRTPLETFNKVVRDLLDLNEIDPHTVWNLIPFTWLADYFIDLSSYFDALYADPLYQPDYICLVRRDSWIRVGKVTQKPNWCHASGFHSKTLYTKRTVHNDVVATLPRGLNLLTWSQAKVVMALLAVFRDGRR